MLIKVLFINISFEVYFMFISFNQMLMVVRQNHVIRVIVQTNSEGTSVNAMSDSRETTVILT